MPFRHDGLLGHYILEGHTPVLCPDVMQWAEWFETADRTVGKDYIHGIMVSTVFLGLDHNFCDSGSPILFETMLASEIEFLELQTRYATWEEAEVGHKLVVEQLRISLPVFAETVEQNGPSADEKHSEHGI